MSSEASLLAGRISVAVSKMFKLAIFALIVTVASASSEANWFVYKKTHNKTYTEDEDILRRLIWQTNLQKIDQQNELYAQGLSSYYMGENQYSDLTNEEIKRLLNGLLINRPLNPGTYQSGQYKDILVDTVDWRTKGYVTPVKDQGLCGSCYAFSTTGSLEGQHFKATGKLVSLSESNLVDCTKKFGNFGCNGGYMDNNFKYIISNKGIDTESSYPYKLEQEKCHYSKAGVGATIRSYIDIKSGNEDALQKAVAEIGPISVAIDALDPNFWSYKGGIYDQPNCTNYTLSHAVLVVGYGAESGKDYWIVKNSSGPTWGIKGYILMSRNKNNQCGIASLASYPVV